MNISNMLAANWIGRIILHVSCAMRRPEQAKWHYRGILRELNLSAALAAVTFRASILLSALILSL